MGVDSVGTAVVVAPGPKSGENIPGSDATHSIAEHFILSLYQFFEKCH